MSWETLASIERERQVERDRDHAEPPEACPNDGEPLIADPRNGGLVCRFDGWAWPSDGEGF